MTLLDRFRARPPWQSPDPQVRAAAVRQLGADQSEVVATIARDDEDPRVRRAAVQRLDDPLALAERARDDGDESVRQEATGRLVHMAEAAEDPALAAAAMAGLGDARHLSALARTARLPSTRAAAVARLEDPRALAAVAKTAPDPATRQAALDAIRDPAALAEVALKSEHKDVAVAAVGRLDDTAALQTVAARARNSAAARRARSVLDARPGVTAVLAAEAVPDPPVPDAPPPPEPEAVAEAAAPAEEPAAVPPAPEPSPPPEPDPRERERQERIALCAKLEALTGEELVDYREESRAAWEGMAPRIEPPELAELEQRFERAMAECRQRFDTVAARRAVEKETAEREAKEKETQARAREAEVRRRQQTLARAQALASRLEALARAEKPTLREVERALREERAVLEALAAVPERKEREALTERLKAGRAALFPKAQELREADDWTRWTNAAKQEELCKRAEALVAEEDLEKTLHRLREIDAAWREVRQAPRGQAETLWLRFKAARDQLHAKLDPYVAKKKEEGQANLKKKEELVGRAEALSGSTDWLKTADEFRRLQGEWKQIGTTPHRPSQVLWERFRGAADRFFSRRKEDLDRRKHEWAANLQRKEALCGRAEEVMGSSDWEATLAEIKRLQAEWRTVGPVRKSKADAIWQRFRKAVDAFMERYAQRDELGRAAAAAEREAMVRELEEIPAGGDATEVAAKVLAVVARWRQAGPPPRDATDVARRFAEARNHVVEAHPEAFRKTELDPEANRSRMEKLCAKVEALLPKVEAAAGASLAERLKEALAANTMGAKGEAEARWKAGAAEVEAAQAAWKRLGPVPGDAGRVLGERFESACQRFFASRPRPNR
ncbi:MAG: hypothetical protein DMF82_03755 [Acidobacteria bacterium]|nr:MAG: hypothetical protein DMF82_03755 [Acidobacteriota bacterium]